MRIQSTAIVLMLSSIAAGAEPSKSKLDGDPVSDRAPVRHNDESATPLDEELDRHEDTYLNARLEGHVLNVQRRSGTEFVEVFLGADDKVAKGDLIFLSRPDGLRLGHLKYLGSIRITLLTPDRAVGRTVDKVKGVAFQRGDRADTKDPREHVVGDSAQDIDGYIYWVDSVSKVVWIGLGTADGLALRTTFDVLPLPVPKEGQLSDHVKGTIEVTRLLGPNMAEARILSETRPLIKGDLLFNAAWSPVIPQNGHFQIVVADGTRYRMHRDGAVEILWNNERIGLVTRHESRAGEVELPRRVLADDYLVLGSVEKQQERPPHRAHVLYVKGDWAKSLTLRAADESVYQVSTLAGRPVRVQLRENRLLLVVDLPQGEPFQWNRELISRRTKINRNRVLSEEQRQTRPNGGYRSGQTGSLGRQHELTVIEVFGELKQIDSKDRPARARRPD